MVLTGLSGQHSEIGVGSTHCRVALEGGGIFGRHRAGEPVQSRLTGGFREASRVDADVRPAVGQQPVIVDGTFGWLHSGQTAAHDAAVLLCPALGWDGLHAYHGFRILADRFAASGIPAMRFHYPGTGDSADVRPGPDGTVDHWAAWRRSVHAMADRLRTVTGARRLVLVGLRFGALLAATVAQEREDVEALVMMAPVLRGKSYMRQLDMEARLESGALADMADPAGGLEFHELRLSAATVQTIGAVDLRHARLRAGSTVAVFSQAPSQLLEDCTRSWTAAGVEVRGEDFTGLEPLLQEAIHADPPPPDFARVLGFVMAAARADTGRPAAAVPDGVGAGPAHLDLGHCTETPVRFGSNGSLCGILCQPSVTHGDRAVIIGNTGRDPHYGIARFGTDLARRLAAQGIASFRIDFAGLGDSRSPASSPDVLSALFDADRTGDISAAIDALAPFGYREVAVQGLCSGAYHAYRAAQADPRITSLLLVNLPTFNWQGGDTVKQALWKSAPPSRMLLRLADKDAWMRALRGRADLRGILRGIGQRTGETVCAKLSAWFGLAGSAQPQDGPERAVGSLSGRKVRMLFLYSVGDPGLDALVMAFGQGGLALRAFPGVDLRIIAGIDHVLSGRSMRDKAANEIVSFLGADRPIRATAGRSVLHDRSNNHPRPDDHGGPFAEADVSAAAR